MTGKRISKLLCAIAFILAWTLLPAAQSDVQAQAKTQKMLSGGRVGDPWYVLSQALANFVNKQSDWLRLEVVATPGADAGNELAEKDPDKYIFTASYYAMKLLPKMEKFNNYDRMRIIGFAVPNAWLWVTYDEKIKTAEDFVGKKAYLGRPGGLRLPVEEGVLKELGLFEKMKIVRGGYGGGKSAMQDGLVDIAVMLFDHNLPDHVSKGAFLQEMETRKPLHYPNIMPKDLQLKLDMVPLRIRPGLLDPKTQTEELWASVIPLFWCADARMDEAVVYEVTRVLYENAGKYAEWHAQGASLTKEFIPSYMISTDWVHPGAMKYYKEKGIPVRPFRDLLP